MIDPQPLIDKYLPGWTYKFIPGDEYYAEAILEDKEIVFLPEACAEFAEYEEAQKHIVLHEIAHGVLGYGGHDNNFYGALETLVLAEGDIPLELARLMEWRNSEYFSGLTGSD